MRKLTLFAALLILVLSASPVAASSPPQDVEIVVITTIPPDGPPFGPFVATGPAVDAGLICPSGDTIAVENPASGWRSRTGINLHVKTLFTCADGSGTFLAKLEVRIDYRGDNATWMILEGTGDYAKLHGTGKLFGTYFDGA
jgi:hypothetical protein